MTIAFPGYGGVTSGVSRSELEARLESIVAGTGGVTQAQLDEAIAGIPTGGGDGVAQTYVDTLETNLQTAINARVTTQQLTDAVAGKASTQDVATAVADRVTTSQLATATALADTVSPTEAKAPKGSAVSTAITSAINGITKEIDVPEKFGAVGDGIADDTTAMLAWAASLNPNKAFTRQYKISSEIDLSKARSIQGSGEIIGTHDAGNVVAIRGAVTQIGTATGTRGAYTLTVSSSAGMVEGSLIGIHDDVDFSFSKYRNYYKNGEFIIVKAVLSATEVSLTQPLDGTYSSSKLYRITPVRANWNGGVVRSLGLASATYFDLMAQCRLSLQAVGGNYAALQLSRCVNMQLSNCGGQTNRPLTNLQYGLAIVNSQGIDVQGGSFHGTRHGITTTGKAGPMCVPCRDLSVISARVSNDVTYRGGSCNTHGNTERMRWVNCRVTGGFTWGGGDLSILGCELEATGDAAIEAVELIGGTLTVDRLTARIGSDRNANLLDVGYDTVDLNADITRPVNMHISNLDVTYTVPQTLLYGVWIRNDGCTQKINFKHSGSSVIKGDGRTGFARLDVHTNTVAYSDYQICKGITPLPLFTASPVVALKNGFLSATVIDLQV